MGVQVTALHHESNGTWALDVTDKAADSSQRVGGFSGIVLADYLAAKAGAVSSPSFQMHAALRVLSQGYQVKRSMADTSLL